MKTSLPADLATKTPQSVLCEADTDLFTATGHGYAAGDAVVFSDLTGGTGITAGTTYYVIAAGLTADDFKVSATRGGSTIAVSADLTAGKVKQLPNWADLKTIFNREDLGHIAKYYAINNASSLGPTDDSYFDAAVLQDFYLNRRLPA